MDKAKSPKLRADLALVIIAATWGLSFPLTKNALQYITSFQFLGVRFTIGSLIVAFIFFKKIKPNLNTRVFTNGALLSLFLYGANASQVIGLVFTTASNSAFVTGSSIVLVPFMAYVLLKRKPNNSAIAGVILAIIGLYLLTTNGVGISNINKGDYITLISAFLFALYLVLIEKWIDPKESLATGVVMILYVALWYDLTWIIFEPKPLIINTELIIIFLITGVFCTAICYIGHIYVQKYTTPLHAALLLMVEPIFALILASIIPNIHGVTETISFVAGIGIIFMLSGMVVAEVGNVSNH